MAQDDRQRCSDSIIPLPERPAQEGLDTESRKGTGCDERSLETLRQLRTTDGHRAYVGGRQVLEGAHLLPQVPVIVHGNTSLLDTG